METDRSAAPKAAALAFGGAGAIGKETAPEAQNAA
jgi:hypothetical protein